MIKEKLYSPKEASEILGVCVATIQRWDRIGKLKVIRTPAGRRRIPQSELNRLIQTLDESHERSTKKDTVAIYSRVSSHEQRRKGDLDRQINILTDFINSTLDTNIITISDVASGLNDKRKGLIKLMEMAKNKEISKIFITYRDRLTRFGFNYLKVYFNSYNVDIIILNDETNTIKNPESELVDDLMSIITSFSGKIYGLRSGKNNRVKKNVKKIIQDNLEKY